MQSGWGAEWGWSPWRAASQLLQYTGAQLLGGREVTGVRQARVKAVLVRQREGSAARCANPAACPEQAGGEGGADARQKGSPAVFNPVSRSDLPGVSKALRCGKMKLLLL